MQRINRNDLLQQISGCPQWDILVIGGGASGLGIALEAALRGYKTLLVEQADFAKGTSSRSTKLVHGGVRYLAQGNIKLVREACIERGLLCRNAPHLVKKQAFVVPVYGVWSTLKYTLGLKLYDAIAGKYSLGKSVFLSKNNTLKHLPGINPKGLLGGIRYYDAQFNDAALAINLAQAINGRAGSVAINYMQLQSFAKDAQQRLCGAVMADVETGSLYKIKAKAMVNATGVFADAILQMDSGAAPPTICASQGVHLVLDAHWLPGNNALMIPRTSDGRVLFAVPWMGKLLLGTTDTPVPHISQEPMALAAEINFILETAGNYLTSRPTRKDVRSVFAGLRPLAVTKGSHASTKEISRSHKMVVSASQLFTMLGGKWTTYRKMGEDMINLIEKQLQWPATKSVSAGFVLPDSFYLTVKKEEPEQYMSDALGITEAQIQYAIQYQMARTLEDILCRRSRVLFLDAAEAQRIAPQIAAAMAKLLQQDAHWQQQQLDDFVQLSRQYLLH